MNWNPFAKLGSAKQRMLTSSEQREFEKKKDDMIHFEKTSKKLYHDVKKLGDSLNALNRCEYQLARDFQLSLGKASGSGANVDDKFVESWLRSCEKTDRLTTDLNRSLNTEVSEPMKNFNVVFQNWRSALKRWETSLQDCARFHQKLEKLQEKGADPSPQNVAKMNETKRSLDASREEFSHLHSKLMEEMDLLKQKRLDYFDPTVDSLIAQQLRYFKEMERSYGEFVRRTSVVDLSKSFEGDSIEQKLNEIRSLSITACN